MPGLYVFGLFAIATASVTQGHSGCSERGAPDHGRVRVILQRAAGLMVAYSCDPGYLRTGHVYSVCLRGEWTAPLPTCISAKGHSGGKTDGAAGDQGVLVSHQELPSTQRSIVARRVVKTKQTRRKRKRKRKDKRILPPAIEGSDSPTEKSLDTSCLLGTTDGIPKFVRPPKVPNAVGPKFIRKKTGTQKYLVAIYRCVAGYKLHNPHSRSLGCQGGKWVGTLPICLPRRKKIGCINAGCDHGCKEVNGKPKCFCFRGFRQNGKQCFDENECFVDNGGCQQSCHNTPGSFYCGCPPGYRLTNDRSSCVDINECLSRNGHGPCQGQCHNVDGSFVCSCEGFPGSQLADDGVSCADINECNDPVHRLNCSHACVNTRGSAFCLCPLGFEVGADWTTCQDINECERHIAPCDDGCVNTIGSFTCISEGCSTGYVLINGTCEDVDECTANVSICSHSCSNTPGSFTCSCPIGFVLAQDGKTCLDNDECSEFAEGHLCSHICQNTLGSYYCLCPSDHELASDHRTCHPKEDECQRKNCSHDCLIEENHVKCVCDKGYVLENEITCVDIDECEENLANCSHGCDNDEGTFYCTCPTGYSLLTDKKTCVRRDCDLKTCNLEKTEDSNCSCPEVFESNEGNCDNGESLSSQLCRNNEGSVESNCEEGFYLSSDRRSCIDFDECQEETICPSSKTCVNTEGSYLCNCPPGFRDVNGTTFCEDINECTFTIDEGSSLCSHTCINTLGTYHCECPLGYMMGKDSRTCEDIDECSENNEIDTTCSHKCVNSLGSYRCECPEHYKLESDHICVVAGGCDINNGGCSHICIENGEYPICECHKGFILANDNVTCESHLHSCSDGYSYQVTTQQCADINECLENNGNCSQICENIEGSFYCSCFPGFEKIGYSHTCLDINECTNNVSVCDQVCINTEGSYKCGCSAGYTLSESLTECVHIDECVNNTLCDQICKNSDGSFKCECNPGYILSSDGVSCEDVNECILHSSNCSQICKNLDGGFLCECNPGFELVNGSICVEEKNTIKEGYSENGNLIIKGEMKCCCTIGQASNCHQSDNCDLSTSEIVPCLSKIKEEALDEDLAECNKLISDCLHHLQGCSPLFPDDSSVDLDCKLTTQEDVYHPVGTECRVRCRPGYKLDGVRVTTCLNGTWTGSFQCIAQIRPYIKCPPAIRLNLPLGKNTTTVNIPQPKTNMNWEKHVTSNPSWGKQFQNTLTVGTISVQFSAVSPSSNAVAKCTTSIQVKDVERPTIHGCPEKMEVFVQRGENSAEARWTEPNVTDNVKVAYFYQSKRPGVMLSRGLHEINYIATDSSGNIATCQFTISVEYEK